MSRTAILCSEDAAALGRLLDSELGAGLYPEAKILQDLADPGALVLAVRDSEHLVGGAISRLLVPEDAGYYRAFGDDVAPVFRRGPVGSVEAIAVVPQARGGRLGSELLKTSVDWMKGQRCHAAVAVSWISGRASSAGIFARAGFEAGRTVNDFYLEESLRDGWTCPVCAGPCHCAGQFVHRALGN